MIIDYNLPFKSNSNFNFIFFYVNIITHTMFKDILLIICSYNINIIYINKYTLKIYINNLYSNNMSFNFFHISCNVTDCPI